jgi:hypothetical protein
MRISEKTMKRKEGGKRERKKQKQNMLVEYLKYLLQIVGTIFFLGVS